MNNVNADASTLQLKWGTQTPVTFNDPKYGELQINAFGNCNYIINDPNINVEQTKDILVEYIRSSFTSLIGGSQISYLDFKSYDSEILKNKIISVIPNYVTLVDINIQSINLTKESEKKVQETDEKNLTVVVQTDVGAKDGQTKCPKCGSTEITPVGEGGKLMCNFCRHQFEGKKVEGLDGDITQLTGQVIASGAQDINEDFNSMITLKCSSCGAEVVIDTSEVTHARCHWCRNTLTINQQIPNGSVPDVVLPFFISKDDAKNAIDKFVKSRQFFAHPKFKAEFTTENILGVYFPYMIVDVNAHCLLKGQGEHLTRTYTVNVNDHARTYYDADVYNVEREFDIAIDDLTIESSADKLNTNVEDKTTNVINAIMPFDLMNVVKWDANYLRGYSSEKRDLNIEQLKPFVEMQSKDVARFAANDSLEFYDRGVCWSQESIDIKGQQWKSAYLPVWLYSYQEIKGKEKLLHYVAVNGRTMEVMGSVPINMTKLIVVSAIIEFFSFLAMLFIEFEGNYIFLAIGVIYFFIIYSKYRNKDARHRHELETRRLVTNLRQVDNYYGSNNKQSSSRMDGANNLNVSGTNAEVNLIRDFLKKNIK